MPRSCRNPAIRSLVFATDLDVLQLDRRIDRRADHWTVISPSNPSFWWGNLLLFDEPPAPGDGDRWERLFAEEVAVDPRVRHRTFAWDRTDGEAGAAETEFVARGYELEWTAGLVASREELRPHPRANREVEVRALRPGAGEDEDLWSQVVEIQVADGHPQVPEADHREFCRTRQGELREIFLQGRGSWYVALDAVRVVGSLGIVVTDRRARYQTVDTLSSHRRRGIASRLVAEAAQMALEDHQIDNFVIAADPDYHAIGIYEDLGFRRVELVCGAVKRPSGD